MQIKQGCWVGIMALCATPMALAGGLADDLMGQVNSDVAGGVNQAVDAAHLSDAAYAADQSGFYVGVSGGIYGRYFQAESSPTVDKAHTWLAGAQLGYQADDVWSYELGGYYLNKSTLSSLGEFKDWFLYAALVGRLPVFDASHVFAKLGGTFISSKAGTTKSNLFTPYLAFGVSTPLLSWCDVSLQYAYLPSVKDRSVSSNNYRYQYHALTLGLTAHFT